MIKKFFKNKNGQATIEFLITATLIFMVVFGSIDYWLAVMKIQQGEHVKNYYLDRARITGHLSPEERVNLISDMGKAGFKDIVINAPNVPQLRDINNQPVIDVKITAQFTERPFMLSTFLGKNENTQITFSGRTLSECVE